MFVIKIENNKNKKTYLEDDSKYSSFPGNITSISFCSSIDDAWKFDDEEYVKFVSFYLRFKYNYKTIIEKI